jgi:predicted nuclease of predicted toxin-antitoxin system
MSIKILVDVNLSPDWVPFLEGAGWSTAHWSAFGDPRARDRSIMDWAEANGYVVFTHNLDFGTLLALTHRTGPSVLQVRGEDVLPEHMGNFVVAAIRQHETELESGALIVVEERKNRVRVLPI